MTKEILTELLQKHLAGTASLPEKNELIQFIRLNRDPELLKEVIAETMEQDVPEHTQDMQSAEWDQTLQNVYNIDRSGIPEIQSGKKRKLVLWTAAAAVLIALLAGGYFFIFRNNPAGDIARSKQAFPAIPPASSELILSDGTRIVLDAQPDGKIAQAGSVVIYKEAGKLRVAGTVADLKGSGYLLSTSRTDQYQLQFSDGSLVWLNAASAIRFTANPRQLELSGEAWFDVQSDASAPFTVLAGSRSVIVLGTSFDVKAYASQTVQAITVETGKVGVMEGSRKLAELATGQQLRLYAGDSMSVRNVLTANVAPWRKKELSYQDEYLKDIISDLGLYYNNPVTIDSDFLKNTKVTVRLNRNDAIRELLLIICKTVGAQLTETENGTFLLKSDKGTGL